MPRSYPTLTRFVLTSRTVNITAPMSMLDADAERVYAHLYPLLVEKLEAAAIDVLRQVDPDQTYGLQFER